jgi:ribosomal-protein-alanine N-acetyltransferase
VLSLQLTPFTELRTTRLLLRRVVPADAAALLFLRSDEQVMRYLDREPTTTLAECEQVIRRLDETLERNEGIVWALTPLGEERRLIGTCGIWRFDAANHRGEVGYVLHPDSWGQGLMNEALAAVCRFGFEQLRLHSLEGNINPGNVASGRLLERLGFVREAYFRENYYFRGQFLDSVIYSLLAPRLGPA